MAKIAITQHEYSLDNGSTWATCTNAMDNGDDTATIPVGSIALPIGHLIVRRIGETNPAKFLRNNAEFTVSSGGTPDIPDTFPTINALYTQVNGNSLIAAEGDDAAKKIWDRLGPLLGQSGKTIYGQQFGVNGVTTTVLLQANNMTNMVYNPYYQNGGDLKILLAYEYTNELSAQIGAGLTPLQAAQVVYDQMAELCAKARNKDNTNPDFVQPGGAAANTGDGYRVGIILPLDCARTGHRTAIAWLRTQILANYRQFANFVVDLSANPYIGVLGVAGVEGTGVRNPYWTDGTHQTETGELIFTDGMRKGIFDYLGLAIPSDISALTASLSAGTVTASVTSLSAIEYRIKEGTGAWSDWQGHGVFPGITGTPYTVEARMIYKPAAILSFEDTGTPAAYEPETDAYLTRISSFTPTVKDPDFVNALIVHAKANNYYNDLIFAGGGQTGYYISGGAATCFNIMGTDLIAPSPAKNPAIITNAAGRDVFDFEGQITMGDNDILINALPQPTADRLNGIKNITHIAVAKAANRSTSYGQAIMNFGDVGDFYIGTDTAGALVVRRNVATAAATTVNTGQAVCIGGRFNATTNDMDVWINGTKEATTNIASPYNISTGTPNLCMGSGLHTIPLLGQVEFGITLASAPSDALMASIQNFLLTNLPI